MQSIPRSERLFSNHDLWLLIWPLVVEQLLNLTLGIADIVMVASLGEYAVSGVSLVDAMNILIVQVYAALGTGGAVVAAQYIGHHAVDKAAHTARQLLYTVFFLSLIIMAAGLLSHRALLPAVFGKVDSDVMDASRRYFVITMLALPAIAVYNACAALFRAQGNSRVSMLISVLINILNIGGNAFFIFVLHWGVEGVAFPTMISRTVAAGILLVLLYRGKSYNGRPAISIKGITRVHFDFSVIKKILSIGIPNGLESGTFQIGKILVLSLIASYGTVAIAANAAANTLATFEVLPGNAVGLAILTVVGQCIGAGKLDQAEYYAKKLLAIAYAAVIVLNIPLLMCADNILAFYHMSAETTRLAWYMGVWHGLCAMVFWPMSFTLPNVLRAANDAAFTMIVSIISMWSVRVGMCYVFRATNVFGLVDFLSWPPSFGAMGVWIAMIMDWIFRLTCFLVRFFHGRWKTKTLI